MEEKQTSGTPPPTEGGTEQRKVSTEGFVGILFAVLALGVMFWVGVRLMEPYPTFQPPEQAVQKAKDELAGSRERTLKPAPQGVNSQKLTADSASTSKDNTAGNEKDPICGMNPYESPTRLEIDYSDGTRIAYVSMACYFQHREALEKEGKKPTRERVVDFATWQSENPKLLDFSSAVWLIDLEFLPPGSMPPGISAFASEEEAHKFHGDLGGRIVSLEEVRKFVQDYLAE